MAYSLERGRRRRSKIYVIYGRNPLGFRKDDDMGTPSVTSPLCFMA